MQCSEPYPERLFVRLRGFWAALRAIAARPQVIIDDGHVLIQTHRKITPRQRERFIDAYRNASARYIIRENPDELGYWIETR